MRAATRAVRTQRAVRIVRSVVERRWLPLQAAWEAECSQLAPAERSLLRDITSGTLRHLAYYDRLLDYVEPRAAQDGHLRVLAAATLYQAERMERAPTLSALCRAAADSCPSSLTKARVESACRQVAGLPARERRDMLCPASALSLPSWLHTRLRTQGPLSEYGPLLLERPDSLSLCVPPQLYSRSEYLQLLRAAGHPASPSGLAPHGVLVGTRPRDVGALPGLTERRVHVQDAVQQFGASLLRPLAAGDRVLDACAAPGGKSRALLGHQPHAAVLALEVDRRKADAMAADMAARATTASRVAVSRGDALDPAAWWDGVPFGAVLLDAPCSASGLLRTLPEAKVHQSEASLHASAAKQLRLLHALWPLLRPGGELLYSTCSILSEENEAIVSAFLAATADARPARLRRPKAAPKAAAASRGSNVAAVVELPPWHVQRRGPAGLIFYPCSQHQGGFVALLQKDG